MLLSRKNISVLIALLIYTIAAWFEAGYFHPDEHYQLIEFAGLKTGFNSPGNLPWEYHSAMRPALQPYICIAIFRLLSWTHITDPYLNAFALRWLTALVSIFVISRFVRTMLPHVTPALKNAFILLSYFLWFMPYLNTRFSSEIWAGLSILLAVSLVLDTTRVRWPHYLVAGIMLGLAFNFRFQSVFLAGGLLAWLTFMQRLSIEKLLLVLGGICLSLGIGILADCIYYGFPVLTFINYFRINITQGVAAQFGTEPWFYYIYYILQNAQLLIGVLIAASYVVLLILRPKNVIIWITLPFLIVHMSIAHKEGRFLFPMVYFIPIILVQAWELLLPHLQKIKFWTNAILFTALLLNILGLVAISFKPAGNGRKALSSYIHDHYGNACVNIYHTYLSNPYNSWEGLDENFYLEKCLQTNKITLQTLPENKENGAILLVCRENEADQYLTQKGWAKRKQSIPDWIQFLQQFYHGYDTEKGLILYEKVR